MRYRADAAKRWGGDAGKRWRDTVSEDAADWRTAHLVADEASSADQENNGTRNRFAADRG